MLQLGAITLLLICGNIGLCIAAPPALDEYGHGMSVAAQEVSQSAVYDQDWEKLAQDELNARLNIKQNTNRAKNVIFFIGDGMGISTLTAARFYMAQQNGVGIEETKLSWEKLPQTGIIKTYNVDAQTPDSAGTATAFNCGRKTRYGVIGVNQQVPRGNCSALIGNELKSALTRSLEDGKWAGLVTTARVTHATPAASYAHSPDRDWESDSKMPAGERQGPCKDLAAQLIDGETNQKLRVILGGGREMMYPDTVTDSEYQQRFGNRLDGRNLVEEWKQQKINTAHTYVTNQSDFDRVDAENTDYLLGLFEPGHMQYETDRDGEPSLAEMVEKAIRMLRRSDEGFYLYVEGGRIDHAHHENNARRSLTDTLALSAAVQKAIDMTDDEDTLLVVTADHSHVFTMGGYPPLDNDILGLVHGVKGDGLSLADDGKPWLTLSYANGPGHLYHRGGQDSARRNLTADSTDDVDYLQPAGFYRPSETHGGEDVGVFARGPMSHLFVGSHEQHYIQHAILYASCLDNTKKHCSNKFSSAVKPLAGSYIGLLVCSVLCLFTCKTWLIC